MSAKLGEILVRENLISPQHLREALDYQREHGGRLGFTLVKLGLVSDDMITAVLARQYGIPSVNLDLFHIDQSVLRLIPQEVAQKYSVLPLSRVGATLTLAMVDPTNVFAMDDVKFMTGLNVEPVVVAEASVQQAIAKYYGSPGQRSFRSGHQAFERQYYPCRSGLTRHDRLRNGPGRRRRGGGRQRRDRSFDVVEDQ